MTKNQLLMMPKMLQVDCMTQYDQKQHIIVSKMLQFDYMAQYGQKMTQLRHGIALLCLTVPYCAFQSLSEMHSRN